MGGEEIDGDDLHTRLVRNVRQVGDGGLGCRAMYVASEAWEISMPSFRSSLWIRGAPKRIISADRMDPRALSVERRPSGYFMGNIVDPVPAKASSVRSHDGLEFDDR